MSVTRITKLRGFSDVLAGRDLAKIFKEGHVYQVIDIMGTIMINDLGEHAESPQYKGSGLGGIMTDGSYCLTKAEYDKQHEDD